jgi:hypothetical protein
MLFVLRRADSRRDPAAVAAALDAHLAAVAAAS